MTDVRDILLTDVDHAEAAERLQDVTDAVTENVNQRVERAIVGAWMAGFDTLDVLQPRTPQTPMGEADLESFSIRVACIPHDVPDREWPAEYAVTRHDLTELDPTSARSALERWGGSDD